jgi:hypothetical protein
LVSPDIWAAASAWASAIRPKMPLLTELENLFVLGLQIFRTYGAAGDKIIVPTIHS